MISNDLMKSVPADMRASAEFLLAHLPDSDREAMTDAWFLAELTAAHQVRHASPTGMDVPEEIWLNNVLPHRFIDETPMPWRVDMWERFVEPTHRAASVEDAVYWLNRNVYEIYGVRYHPTKRPHNNMNVAECREVGFASCTGLSILLAAACRAVGLPARLAGVTWPVDQEGDNHTWVEVWDRGVWRVVAARESFGFDRTWFNCRVKGLPVFAVSYAATDAPFPMVWESKHTVHGADVSDRYAALPPTAASPTQIEVRPRAVVIPRIGGEIELTGKLDDPAWAEAEWSAPFVDIEGHLKPPPRFETRVKMLASPTCFYVGAFLKDPHVWGTLTEKNSIMFNDPDFEIFIDPTGDHHNYYEFEINALGTIWELAIERPYRDGGPVHRGENLPNLRSAVHVHGTLNDPSEQDEGWSLEVAIPWADMARFRGGETGPPLEGEQWKVNFSRVHWCFDIVDGAYRKIHRLCHPEDNWVWSPQGAIDMHRPERWGIVQFGGGALRPDESWPAREALMELYYLQKLRAVPARDISELKLGRLDPEVKYVEVIPGSEVDGSGWSAVARLVDGRSFMVTDRGRFTECV